METSKPDKRFKNIVVSDNLYYSINLNAWKIIIKHTNRQRNFQKPFQNWHLAGEGVEKREPSYTVGGNAN